MRVTLLGTGGSAGVPMLGGTDGRGDWGACNAAEPRNTRSRTSLLIDGGQGGLLVDTSPDLRQQMLACGVQDVSAILFTHAHADHILGVDDVRGLNRMMGRPLEAFGRAKVLAEIQGRFGYAFLPWQPPGFFRPVLLPVPAEPGETVTAAGMRVQVFDQDHGFSRSLGLRTGAFGYSTDAVELDETALGVLQGVDTWVVGCFQRQTHHTHAWLGRVYEWVDRLRPRRTVLTHMGVDMDYGWLRANLPPGIEAGFDGMVIEVAG